MQTARQTRQTTRQRKRSRKLVLGTTAVLSVVGLLVCLAMTVLRPDPGVEAAPVAAPVAGAEAGASPAPSAALPTDVVSPAAAPAPTPTPSAAVTSGTAKPSPTASSQTSAATVPSAGRIQPKATYKGVATAYEAADGNGACLFGPSDDLMIAAMNTTDYESSRACGAYVLVRAANGASITVRIVNECPLPCAPGQLDLSQQAFAKLADLKVGRIPITWSLLSPGTSGTLSIRYKTGSSAYWCGIQVINHRNPVARLEVRTAAGWRQLTRTAYNYFLAADGNGCGGSIRITDIYGEQLTVDGIAVKADVVQPTRVQFAVH
ncbi:expansin EXLX1 family cellulose-binding protein [Kitasatospora sp. P5_F3]